MLKSFRQPIAITWDMFGLQNHPTHPEKFIAQHSQAPCWPTLSYFQLIQHLPNSLSNQHHIAGKVYCQAQALSHFQLTQPHTT
jgi:hypothetical protein